MINLVVRYWDILKEEIWQNILLDDSAEFTILLSYEHMPNTLLINVISTVSNLSLYLHDLMNNG